MIQSGGSILGEGVDGCVFTAPTWPCAQQPGRSVSSSPNPRDTSVVSKLVEKTDEEGIAIQTAMSVLGYSMSQKYLAPLKSECAPANNSHKAPFAQQGAYQASKSAVLAWNDDSKACGKIKKQIISKKGIFDTHKIMYIQRYPITLYGWGQRQTGKPVRSLIAQLARAIPDFMDPLQKLIHHPSTPVYNIDLHNQNIFVRSSPGAPLSFGIADFGHCMIGPSAGVYLTKYIARYEFFTGYNQVPLEARLLNYCYRKNLDALPPDTLVKAWGLEKSNQITKETRDPLVLIAVPLINYLLTKPTFIALVRELQAISTRIRTASLAGLTSQQKLIVDFILSRYMIASPVNSILEFVFDLAPHTIPEAIQIANDVFQSPSASPVGNDVKRVMKFYVDIIRAPYVQPGSGSPTSLGSSLTAVRGADVKLLWDTS